VRQRTGGIINPCCLHNGTHSWSQCQQNPNSQNYQPTGRFNYQGGQGHTQGGCGGYNNNNQHNYGNNNNYGGGP
jgi:hypothetical protein